MSKRIPLRKKYKMKKKIAEHNRKLRKAAKKNPSFVQKKLNKSVEGRIPNSFPFKEELLKSLQEKTEMKIEERQAHQKEARQKEQDKKRKLVSNPDLYTYVSKSAEKDLEYEKKSDGTMALMKDLFTREAKDTSMQAYYHEFKKVIESADVIIEVLDARDPIGCRCPDVEETIITKYPNKRIILLLNKIDLVPRQNVEKWMAYLRNSHPTVAFKSSTQRKGKISHSEKKFSNASDVNLQNSESLGADALLQLLKHYARTGSIRTSITVGIIGFPNVGKSSVINSLCRVRAAKVGATPGMTKVSQEIHLDKRVKLLDTPGIVFPKANDVSDDIILRNVVKLEQVADPVSPVSVILERCQKDVILSIYKIPDYNTVTDFLIHVARKNGKLSKGGIPNTNAAARLVLQDWTGGKIPFYTEPPTLSADVHVGASIVNQFAPNFDVAQASVLASLDEFNSKEMEVHGMLVKGSSKTISADDVYVNGDSAAQESSGEDDDEDMLPVLTDASNSSTVIPSKAKANTKVASVVSREVKARKQDLTDDADQFNPQTNKNMKKQLKAQKKKQKRSTSAITTTTAPVAAGDEDADYSFATDYGGEEDIDADEIDMDD